MGAREFSNDKMTKDIVYEAVDPSDFEAMIEVDRYGQRSTAFDKIISATHDHFWDPLDPKYIDFSPDWDMEKDYITDPEQIIEMQTSVADKLDEGQKIKFVNMSTKSAFSNILHGEQGALALSASLCHILKDPGAQEYAANQTREEARHVTGFAKYVERRWGKPSPVGSTLGNLLNELVNTKLVWKKLVGMQMMVEGLAMGAFSSFFRYGRDPVMVKLCQLVMTDEAFHHKFGKIWADRTIPQMEADERNAIEDWALEVFQVLLFNLGSPDQKKFAYDAVGLDWEWAQGAVQEAFTDERVRMRMKQSTNIMRVLIKTLVKAGIITDRTAPHYAAYVDMAELYEEGDHMVGDDIAEDGIRYLKQINGGVFSGNLLRTAAE